MHLAWTRHLKGEPKKQSDFENTIRSAWPALSRLVDILEEDDKAIERWVISQKAFDTPNWIHKIAFVNGDHYRKEKIIELIKSIQETKKNDGQ